VAVKASASIALASFSANLREVLPEKNKFDEVLTDREERVRLPVSALEQNQSGDKKGPSQDELEW